MTRKRRKIVDAVLRCQCRTRADTPCRAGHLHLLSVTLAAQIDAEHLRLPATERCQRATVCALDRLPRQSGRFAAGFVRRVAATEQRTSGANAATHSKKHA